MNVLSCFDGISCAQVALRRAGVEIGAYYASEIDRHAIKITQANHPQTVQLGTIILLHHAVCWSDATFNRALSSPFIRHATKAILTDRRAMRTTLIDLICGGSPCQGFSMAGKMLNFDDPPVKALFRVRGSY